MYSRTPAFRVILFSLLIVVIAPFQATAQNAKKTVTLAVTLMANDGKSEAIIQSFKKVEETTGNKVQLNVVPDDQALNMVRTKIATGNADDIIVHPWGAYELPVDQLEPLDGPWAAKITAKAVP